VPLESYKSLFKRKTPVFDGDDWRVYDFTSERGTYVYRDLKRRKFTPVDEKLIKESMKKITGFLREEYKATSEFFKCKEVCQLSWKRYFIALTMLYLAEKKISFNECGEKIYIELVDKRKSVIPLQVKATSPKEIDFMQAVAGSSAYDWLNRVRDEEKKRKLEEYKQYRETYGR